MTTREIVENITAFSVDDRTSKLFEGLWPIQADGVTYNSYLIQDEKNVLVDLSSEFKSDVLMDAVAARVELPRIDYVIVNHMEPDHSGALKALTRLAPNVQIICTPDATPMLDSYYSIRSHIREVADGEKISIGKRTLSFHHTPLVHWPETMVTFDEASGTLFSCDIFGGYGALPDRLYDSDLDNLDEYLKQALRYYSNILAKFSPQVSRMIEKLTRLAPRTIAPSHGLIWKKNPQLIVDLYRKWSDYVKGDNEPRATLIYASMYGNTANAMKAVVRGLSSVDVPVDVFNVAETHLSYILPSLWTNRGVVIGSPTYEGNIFPGIRHVLMDAGAKRIFNKKAAFFGSWSWSSGALREIKSMVEPYQWDVTDALEFEGAAKDSVLEQAEKLGAAFGRKLKIGRQQSDEH